ncbi:hypothetical protein JW698_00975 [Candidatus Wolfebacteria bacterium]|nr:hypothetical protein [Candidatus Wolfebacteria bacterium]
MINKINIKKDIIGLFVFFFLFSFLFFNVQISFAADENSVISVSCAKYNYPWCKEINEGFGALVNNFYTISLGLVGASALGVLIYGAILWTLSGAVTSKQDALQWIWGAVWGLILLMGAYLILNTINPDLIDLKEPEIKQATLSEIKFSGWKPKEETTNTIRYNFDAKGEQYNTREKCEAIGKRMCGDNFIGAIFNEKTLCTVVCKKEKQASSTENEEEKPMQSLEVWEGKITCNGTGGLATNDCSGFSQENCNVNCQAEIKDKCVNGGIISSSCRMVEN